MSYESKSTTTAAQCARLLELLNLRPHTSHELARNGLYHSPARVRELRKRGYDIETQRVNIIDQWGYQHCRVALYKLISAPEQKGGAV